jgi:hypothetical protein
MKNKLFNEYVWRLGVLVGGITTMYLFIYFTEPTHESSKHIPDSTNVKNISITNNSQIDVTRYLGKMNGDGTFIIDTSPAGLQSLVLGYAYGVRWHQTATDIQVFSEDDNVFLTCLMKDKREDGFSYCLKIQIDVDGDCKLYIPPQPDDYHGLCE